MKMHPIVAIAGALTLAACAAEPHLSPYTGLFPEKYAVRTAPPPADPAFFRDKTVALVSSQNFEKYVNIWRETYERGGAQRAAAIGEKMASSVAAIGSEYADAVRLGAQSAAATGEGMRNVMDPRRISDVAVASLKRSFKTVIVAHDFADAVDKHADFIALVDFHSTFSTGLVTETFYMWAGLYMHDARLNQIFKVEYPMESTLSIMGDVMGAQARGMTKTVEEFKKALAARLP